MCGCSRKAYSLDSTPEEVGWGKPLPPTPHLAAPAAAEAVSHGPVPFQTPGFSVSPLGFPDDSVVKNPPAIYIGDAGDTGSIPGLGRSPIGGYGNSLQYSCLENPMDKGVWQATVQRVAESDTTEHAHKPYGWRGGCHKVFL